jgi:glycerophosphoryl diester phosphodiesterase
MTASAQDASPQDQNDRSSRTAGAARVPSGFDLQGHRGARGLAPENTLPAFRKALDLGVTTLELDVVISKDGKVVVSHEPWMSATICRTPDGTPISEDEETEHNIYAMSAEDVARYDCGTREHPRFPDQILQTARKPLLRDVIERAEAVADSTGRPPVFYNVETKIRPEWEGTFTPGPEPFARAVVEVLQETGVASRSTVQSFDPRTLEVVRRLDSTPRIALLISERFDQGLDENLKRLSFRPDIYSPAYALVDADLMADVERLNEGQGRPPLQVIPWTVNEKADMHRLIDRGVDGLITDYPDRALEVVRNRTDVTLAE